MNNYHVTCVNTKKHNSIYIYPTIERNLYNKISLLPSGDISFHQTQFVSICVLNQFHWATETVEFKHLKCHCNTLRFHTVHLFTDLEENLRDSDFNC